MPVMTATVEACRNHHATRGTTALCRNERCASSAEPSTTNCTKLTKTMRPIQTMAAATCPRRTRKAVSARPSAPATINQTTRMAAAMAAPTPKVARGLSMMDCIFPPLHSVDGEQRRTHGAALGQQHVVCTAGCSRIHRFEPDAGRCEGAAHIELRHALMLPGPQQEETKRVAFGERRCERGSADLARARGRPSVDAARQAQDRSAMAHLGEAETTVAVGIDRRPPGIAGWRIGHFEATFSRRPLPVASDLEGDLTAGPLQSRLTPNSSRKGAATKIEE